MAVIFALFTSVARAEELWVCSGNTFTSRPPNGAICRRYQSAIPENSRGERLSVKERSGKPLTEREWRGNSGSLIRTKGDPLRVVINPDLTLSEPAENIDLLDDMLSSLYDLAPSLELRELIPNGWRGLAWSDRTPLRRSDKRRGLSDRNAFNPHEFGDCIANSSDNIFKLSECQIDAPFWEVSKALE